MTIWSSVSAEGDQPMYKQIAEAIADALDEGTLGPGARLPTHRRLADRLGVTVGTVTRGYAEAERRGLVVGEVGRGTFVRGPVGTGVLGAPAGSDDDEIVAELSIALPPETREEVDLLTSTMADIAQAGPLDGLLRYRADSGLLRHREAGAEWIARTGLVASPERVTVTCGVQHALNVLMTTCLRPGDVLLTEELTYPGALAIADRLGIRVRGVETDDQGILPDALERACGGDHAPKAVYLVPTLHNPLGGTLSVERRERIAEIVRAHGIWLFEDDIHGLLPATATPPIATFAPDRTFYATSVTKALAMGLRVGFVVSPADEVDRFRAGLRSSLWMAPPLTTEVATRWITEGGADRILEAKRVEAAERLELAREILEGWGLRAEQGAYYAWLPLPGGWDTGDFVARALEAGCRLAGADAFSARRGAEGAVRIAFGVPSRGRLEVALRALDGLLREGPDCCTVL